MNRTIHLNGFFGGSRRPVEGRVAVSVFGAGMNESLSVAYHGKYEVIVSLRPVEQLASETRRMAQPVGDRRERSIQLSGYCPDVRRSLHQGMVTAWFGIENGFEMLTLEFASDGQISVPFKPIAALIRSTRQNLV